MLTLHLLVTGSVLFGFIFKQTYSTDEALTPVLSLSNRNSSVINSTGTPSINILKTNTNASVLDASHDVNLSSESTSVEKPLNKKEAISEIIKNQSDANSELLASSTAKPKNPNLKPKVTTDSSKSVQDYLTETYSVVKELRKKMMDKIHELKQYLIGNNQHQILGSTDGDDRLKLYHFQKNADFLVEKEIGVREGKEFLQDKVDSILQASESLNDG